MDAIVQSVVGIGTIEGNKDAQGTRSCHQEAVVVATSKLESVGLDDLRMLTCRQVRFGPSRHPFVRHPKFVLSKPGK